MKITDLLSVNTINLNVSAVSKKDIINKAVKLISNSGCINDIKKYKQGVFRREEKMSTGIGEGIAIPHCKSSAVSKPALAAIRIPNGVEYDSLDGEKVKLLFLIAAPNSKNNVHLDVLARLSNILMHSEFVYALMHANTPETFLNILDFAESSIEETHKKDEAKAKNSKTYPRILAVTACPTGIAHTYMAEEALTKKAKEMNVSIKVETNGSGGIKNELTDEEIEHAEGIIIAADVSVYMDRFNGKRLIQCPVTRAITKPKELIDMALDPITSIYGEGRKATKQDRAQSGSKFQIIYRHLMSGISHMIPFVIVGGICLALAYLIDKCCGVMPGKDVEFGNTSIAAKIFHFIGADFGLNLMFPILGGFIAYSIAGKPGLVAGFIGASAAKQGQFSLLYIILYATQGKTDTTNTLANSSSGFLGAIVAGFMAGYLILYIRKKTSKVPASIAGVKDMLIVPLISTILVCAGMFLVNVPLAYINIGIAAGLTALAGIPNMSLLLGALAAGLMAIDMGGPINKATHYVIVGLVTTVINKGLAPTDPNYIVAMQLNGANLLGMLTPPAGIALATWLFPRKFTKGDRIPSIANLITGCCGITEGAIPYVVKNPITTIFSTVAGAACGGMISMSLGFQAIAPEGGFLGMAAIPNPDTFWMALVSCASGALITAFLLGFLRRDVPQEESLCGKWKGIPIPPIYALIDKVSKKSKKKK